MREKDLGNVASGVAGKSGGRIHHLIGKRQFLKQHSTPFLSAVHQINIVYPGARPARDHGDDGRCYFQKGRDDGSSENEGRAQSERQSGSCWKQAGLH